MNWHEGPLQSWYDVHEAIIRDLEALQSDAKLLSRDNLSEFTRNFQFFFDVLQVHSLHEDGVAFPFMEANGIPVPARIRHEHHHELAMLYDVRTQLAALHALPESLNEGELVNDINRQLQEFSDHLRAHIDFEDEQLIPSFEQRLDKEKQKNMINRLVGETPEWIAPQLMGWMFTNISLEHSIHLLQTWRGFLSADVFAKKVAGIHAGVSAERWQQFTEALPELNGILEK